MLTAGWKSLLARKMRLFMSAVAVMLGVAFVAGSFIFTDTLGRTFDGIMKSTVGDVVVRPAGSGDFESTPTTRTIPAAVVADLAAVDGAARADGNVTDFTTFVVSKSGKLIGGQGAPGLGVNYTGGPAAGGLEMMNLVEGHWPTAPGQVVLDKRTAETSGYVTGDTVLLVTAGAQARVEATLVGSATIGGGSMAGASLSIFTTEHAQDLYLGGENVFTDVWVTAEDGVSQEDLRAAAGPVLPEGVEAITGDVAADEAATEIQEALGFITTFLLVFAGIALVVGSFIIVNTFSILVAQRSRELALFRALGASRSQVARSVLVEAFVVGLVGATIGLGLGIGLAHGIRLIFARFGLDMSGAGLVLSPRTIVVAYAVGLIVTVLAAYLPARRAGLVAPVAAMRDDAVLHEGSMARRVLVGFALAAVGAVAMGLGLFGSVDRQMWWIGGGILGVVLGVAMTSPLLGRPLVRGLGAIYRRLFGAVGTMAQENALRNPRRTAATASALMIGVTLVSMMSVFGASAKESVGAEISKNFQADYIVSNVFGMGFSPAVGDEIASVTGVEQVSRVRWGLGQIDGDDKWVVAIDPKTFGDVARVEMVSGSLARLQDGAVLMATDYATENGYDVGETVTATLAGTEVRVTVAGLFTPNITSPGSVWFTLPQFARAGMPQSDGLVYVNRADGASAASVQSELERLTAGLPTISVKDKEAYVDEQRGPIDQMLTLIYALLGLAVVIAILGIVNTLALAVIERTREIGLLRAVGLSRRQLRTMLRLESIVIAVLGAALGVLLGTGFGVAIQRALIDDGITVLSIPWPQLVVFVAVAAVVGVLAAVWPGRRAGKLDILQAVATA